MSFIVQIWEQPEGLPKPTTVLEACDLAEQAARRADPARPNLRLKAFLDQVRERWPITVEAGWPRDDPSKATTDLGVWKDNSLQMDIGDDPALALAIVTDKVDEVLTWMAEAGPLAGVNICDPQNGSAWLADGSVFAMSDEGACAKAMARWFALDDRAAWQQFVELAQRGNLSAFGHLGEMYRLGRFVGRDLAIAWALHAAANRWHSVDGAAAPSDATDAKSAATLTSLRDGLDAAERARFEALFERLRAPGLRATLLAAANEFDARHVAALDLIARGEFAAAAMRLHPLATRGHIPSQHALASLWATGRAKPDDPKQELAWIAAAAKLQDPAALVALARLNEEGVLRKRNVAQARQIHRLLIAQGATSALRDASRAELKRLIGPAPKRLWDGRPTAVLERLVEQGDAEAMVELARGIEWGRSGAEVAAKSRPLWERAAAAGHRDAQCRMASLCEPRKGADGDEERATHWYGLAARQGHGHAQVEYAKRLDAGLGIPRDRKQALHWLEQAARQNIRSALEMMSVSYARGNFYPKDPVAAQLLLVLHDRTLEKGSDDFKGPDEIDPREVRRLLAEIDGGADLLDVLKRRAPPPPPPAPTAGGLTLAPIEAPKAAPPQLPDAPAASREAGRPAVAAVRRQRAAEPEREAVVEPVVRSLVGPLLIVASFGVLSIAVAMLRKDAGANVIAPWLIGSALAAAGAFRLSREQGNPSLVAAMDAVPMIVPFLGSALAARLLYFRWRATAA